MRTITFEDLLAMKPCWSILQLGHYWGNREKVTMWDVATHDGIHPEDKIWVLLRMMTAEERKALTGHQALDAAQEELMFCADYQRYLEEGSWGNPTIYDEEQICRLLLSLGEVPAMTEKRTCGDCRWFNLFGDEDCLAPLPIGGYREDISAYAKNKDALFCDAYEDKIQDQPTSGDFGFVSEQEEPEDD